VLADAAAALEVHVNPETRLQNEIEAAIGAAPDLLLLRNSVGRARHVREDDGTIFFVPYGLGVGSPDLVGMLRAPDGRAVWFCLEVKTADGRVDAEQERCHRVWRDSGAIVEVVRSVDEARAALQRAREGLRAVA